MLRSDVMDVRGWNLVLLTAIGVLWLACGVQREKPVVADDRLALRALESEVALHPDDAVARRLLAQSYLDVRASGLALRTIEFAPRAVRSNPELEHVYARALLDQGRSADALAAEHRVLDACSVGECSMSLLASASRRAAILHELVALGVEDAPAHPEASAVAYHNATREARLALQ
ncbi:hypothetical protein LZC95_42910 [Pendulispora brunnea]|uniref:Tetratricopeptide repeat protein n=1 Tax=Pendulispora brunnea TaxID=2905690 RepID=A0ABZ2K3H1_9BACT